ncbi:hypothetical protein T492DRAFT_876608, partial [Pavlovales sp. CCMP2436]
MPMGRCVESSASVGPTMNSAFVFVTPHAISKATKELVVWSSTGHITADSWP